MAAWLCECQLNHFDSRASRLSGFSSIQQFGVASLRRKSHQNCQIYAVLRWRVTLNIANNATMRHHCGGRSDGQCLVLFG